MSRNGIRSFQTGRLTQALAARQLSQAQLADMVGVSPATITKWKKGIQAPESETLDRLASVLNVTADWFTRNPVETSSPLFRSNASAHVVAREKLGARMAWGEEIVRHLEQFVDLPKLNLPTRPFQTAHEISELELEAAARECRDLWRLGRVAIQDLALAVESAGVVLFREETGITQIEGLSAWSGDRPLILLSADKANGYRSRFDLAHEIAHLVLHRNIKIDSTDKAQHHLLEKQAHFFAGALLLPAETFAREIRIPPTLDDLLVLKKRWGVSVAAMIMRLEALGIIDEFGSQNLFKRRSARWGGKAEPGDKDLVPEAPRLLRRTIDLIVESNVMPIEAIPRLCGLWSGDVERLVGLPFGYLTGANNVVQLARLRDVESTANQLNTPGVVLPFRRR